MSFDSVFAILIDLNVLKIKKTFDLYGKPEWELGRTGLNWAELQKKVLYGQLKTHKYFYHMLYQILYYL